MGRRVEKVKHLNVMATQKTKEPGMNVGGSSEDAGRQIKGRITELCFP